MRQSFSNALRQQGRKQDYGIDNSASEADGQERTLCSSCAGASFILALDWRKAFDAISPERLLWALRRFGLNESMLAVIQDIYSNRVFKVADAGVESTARPQRAGISQGCPLSPFLFGMVMTIVMTDARHALSAEANIACAAGGLEDVLFADDTLLISSCSAHVEEYMATVEKCGPDYGLQLLWGKTQLPHVRASGTVRTPHGNAIVSSDSRLLGVDGAPEWQVSL